MCTKFSSQLRQESFRIMENLVLVQIGFETFLLSQGSRSTWLSEDTVLNDFSFGNKDIFLKKVLRESCYQVIQVGVPFG
jgi:hypothetical protein